MYYTNYIRQKITFLIIILSFVFLGACGSSNNDYINPEDASNFVNEYKAVKGRVVSSFYSQSSNGNPTFINLNKKYPNEVFTIVIWGADRNKFNYSPEDYLKGKEIIVKGYIEEFRGTPQIEVNDPSQLQIE